MKKRDKKLKGYFKNELLKNSEQFKILNCQLSQFLKNKSAENGILIKPTKN